jgi:23S rRNA (cytosine1962-C5)-methyltransferase
MAGTATLRGCRLLFQKYLYNQNKNIMNLKLLTTSRLSDYELIDSGDAEKLERFGNIILKRPDPQAFWRKKLVTEWKNFDAEFVSEGAKGKWKFKTEIQKEWNVQIEDINFELRFPKSGTGFKHVGVFPEQSSNWQWINETITEKTSHNFTPSVLNLFAYTGGATIAALQAGANVTHVDASLGSIEWAKRNTEISGVAERPVRWIVDDAKKFVEREIRRGNHYHGIILDPPSYGHGPKREIWNIEKDFLPLVDSIKKILHSEPLFVLINGYSSGYSALAYAENLAAFEEKFGGTLDAGELSIQDKSGRNLPCGIFARWRK